MTSTVLFGAPVAHHQTKFSDPYSIATEICIEDMSKHSNQTFSRRLSSIIRNKQVIESIDCTDLSEEKLITEDVLNNESPNISEKCSSESSRTSSNNDQNNDSHSEQFNNSVSSTSSISNQCQNALSKSIKSKKKVQFISSENLNISSDTNGSAESSSNSSVANVQATTNFSILIKPDKQPQQTETKRILINSNNSYYQPSYRRSQTIPYNYYSNNSATSINTNRNSVSNFTSSNNYNSFRSAESRLNALISNQRNSNRYSSVHNYTPSYSYRLENRQKHYSLRSNPVTSSMKSSVTLPAISNNITSCSSYQKPSYSAYTISDSDNPFRPDGELAKEAEEFVHQLKEKEEQTVAEILNTKTSSSSIKPSETQSPVKSEKEPAKSTDNASNVVVVASEASNSPKKQDNVTEPAAASAENGTSDKPKKNKTKSKCGCSIS